MATSQVRLSPATGIGLFFATQGQLQKLFELHFAEVRKKQLHIPKRGCHDQLVKRLMKKI